jgi:predicted anti-sigma-YlaC factor YlaD
MTMRERVIRVSILVAFLVSAVLVAGGCSIKRYAVNTIGDVLASGDSVYESDDDIALIGEALPFSLKLVESLLAESPRHRGLLVTAARGFVLYAYAYVQYDADVQALVDLDRARALRGRARRLYERAFGYALRALEQSYPGFSKALSLRPTAAAAMVGTGTNDQDVVLLYWTAASLGLAISVSKTEPAMLARLPEVEALLARALELDEAWNAGALHEFQITWAAAQRTRGDQEELRRHYERALALSRGQRASLYVAYAEAVAVPNQDRTEFVSLMEKALAVDLNADPAHRLLNLIAQRRARWLMQRINDLFL